MVYDEKRSPYSKKHQARNIPQHIFPIQVVIKYPNNDKLQTCGFDSIEEVNDHLQTVRKFNKREMVYLRIYKKGELIKEWRNLNSGISSQ